jgi:hypothetical protein
MMTNDEQSLIDRMCREALDRLARSIGTRVGIAKANQEHYERTARRVHAFYADQLTAAHAAGVRAGMLRAAQMVESMTARERWISGAINSQQAKPCKIAAAIRSEAEREGEK